MRRAKRRFCFALANWATAVALAFVLVAGAAFPAGAVDVQRVRGGDVEAWLVEDHTNPLIAVRIVFRGGAAADPSGKEGLARMTAGLLDEGAGDLDSQAFQKRLNELAVELSFSAGLDTLSGDMRTLTENRDAAFDLLRLALQEPRLDAEPVARIRRQLQATIRREAENPSSVASQRFFSTLFPDHQYGRPVIGTTDSLDAIDTDDLRGFVDRRIARDTLVIGVVGDITPEELAPLLQATFGDLPAASAAVDVADVTSAGDGGTRVEDKPVAQSAMVFGHQGPQRNDPDYYAATLVNHLLGGGGFTSTLYEEVREKRGLVYSVSTSLYPLDHAGLIIGSAATANERAAETMQIVRDQWRQMAQGNITAERLDDAKTFLTGSFPLRLTSSAQVAGILVGMQLDNLGIDYLDRRNALIEAVTVDEANRVAREILDPGKLTFVIAGRPEGIPEGIHVAH
jgi:zinc protease